MKHDPAEWTEGHPFIDGTLCDKDGNEIRSHMTSGMLRCADTLPTESGDYNILVECCFSAAPIYASFDGTHWVGQMGRNVWWFGGKPDAPLYELSGAGPVVPPVDTSLKGRLAAYKASRKP